MTPVEALITIAPHPDGERCGECVGTSHAGWQSCRLRTYLHKSYPPGACVVPGTEAMRGPECLAAEQAARELREENERLREDAERWRFLAREHGSYIHGKRLREWIFGLRQGGITAAIDEAMRIDREAEKPQEET